MAKKRKMVSLISTELSSAKRLFDSKKIDEKEIIWALSVFYRMVIVSPTLRYLPYFLLCFPQLIFSNPKGLVDIQGIELAEIGPHLEIKAKDMAILNWESFSIDQGESTHFYLPDENASVLNRVFGNTRSDILGELKSNGSIFLINPNGVLFGPDSKINVANMIASTYSLSDENFLSQKIVFRRTSEAPIYSKGTIQATGRVLLAADTIDHSGSIEAGSIYMACGDEVLFDSKGNQRLVVSHEFGDTPFEAAIRFDGEALSLDEAFIDAGPGKLAFHGTIEADGGNTHLLGREIEIYPGAKIDVSSENGAGTVLIGGDYKGKNSQIPNAKNVWIGKGAEILANAQNAGDGGKVICWGDDACLFYGTIKAEGGTLSGNGGFIETSSPKWFESDGIVSTLAPFGKAGTYLMDPCAVTIAAGAYSGIATFPPTTYTFSGPAANVSTSVVGTNLASYLNAGNVTIDATTPAVGGAPSPTIDINTGFTWSNNTLTLNAPGGIVSVNEVLVNGNNNGSIIINANQTNIISTTANAEIRVGGTGSATINSNLLIQAGVAGAASANAILDSNPNATITVNGNVTMIGGTSSAQTANALMDTNASITITGTVNMQGGNSAGVGNALARMRGITGGSITINGNANCVGGMATGGDANGTIEPTGSCIINGNVQLQGGTATGPGDANGQIRASDTASSTGTITINGNADCFGGTSIGGAAAGTIGATDGFVLITGNLNATGGTANTAANVSADAGIDMLGGTGPATILGNVTLNGGNASIMGQANGIAQTNGGTLSIGGDVYLQGGNSGAGGNTRAVISARNGATLNIIGGNSITVLGGIGAGDSEGQIHTANMTPGVINIDVSGPITLVGNPTAPAGTHEANINALIGGPINIRCASLDMTAGLSAVSGAVNADAEIDNANGPITIITGALTMNGTTADAHITSNNGNISINAGAMQLFGGNAGTGAAQIQAVGTGDISIVSSSLDLFAGTSGGGATTASIETDVGNIGINSAGLLSLIGGNHATSEAFIHADVVGNITINCGALVMTGGSAATTNASITTDSGDINIHSFSNATLSATLANAPANIQTFGSDLTLIADDNISLNGFSILSTPPTGGNLLAIAGNNFFIDADAQVIVNGTGELTLVCDNDFPTPFGFGSGQFILVPGGTIRNFGGQPVRIFTVSPLQNSFTPPIPATINNFPFTPSTAITFINIDPFEYWCIYYDPTAGAIPPFSGSGIGGNPFTVFYKLCEQTLTVLSTPIQQFLFDLDTFDTYFDEFYSQFEFDYSKVSPLFATINPPVQGNTFRRKLYFENVGRNPEPELINNMPFTALNDEITEEYE